MTSGRRERHGCCTRIQIVKHYPWPCSRELNRRPCVSRACQHLCIQNLQILALQHRKHLNRQDRLILVGRRRSWTCEHLLRARLQHAMTLNEIPQAKSRLKAAWDEQQVYRKRDRHQAQHQIIAVNHLYSERLVRSRGQDFRSPAHTNRRAFTF